MAKVRIEEHLQRIGQSLNWLADTTGIEYKSLWRLKENLSPGIQLAHIDPICNALEITPNELFVISPKRKRITKRRKSRES